MELRHIRYFLEVAETLNFSRAAERLRVAQPALSKQIRDMEEELGGKLLFRTTTKVSLTEMGHYFRQQTRKLVMQLDIAVTGAQQMAKGTAGTIRIGCDWNYGGIPIATAARTFGERNSRTSVQFVELPSHEHLTALRNHTIDLGFAVSFFLGDTDDLELRKLYGVKLSVILPPTHRFANRPSVTLQELKNERWIALNPDGVPGYRVVMAEILQYTPKYGLATASMPGLVAHVVAGHGIGLVPAGMVGIFEDGVVTVDTDCTPLDLFAVSLKDGAPPQVTSFVDLLDEMVKAQRMPRTIRMIGTQPVSGERARVLR